MTTRQSSIYRYTSCCELMILCLASATFASCRFCRHLMLSIHFIFLPFYLLYFRLPSSTRRLSIRAPSLILSHSIPHLLHLDIVARWLETTRARQPTVDSGFLLNAFTLLLGLQCYSPFPGSFSQPPVAAVVDKTTIYGHTPCLPFPYHYVD